MHEDEDTMCDARHKAVVARLFVLTTKPKIKQATLVELWKPQSNRDKFIENTVPIVISDSDDDLPCLPKLTTITENSSFLDLLDSDSESLEAHSEVELEQTGLELDSSKESDSSANPDLSTGTSTVIKDWPCIQQTIHDPVAKSKERTRQSLRTFVFQKLQGESVSKVKPEDWMSWLILWATPRGRCKYANDKKGISPASAKIYFKLLVKVLDKDFNFELLQKFPFMYKFPRKWQKTITKDYHYKRKEAGFFSQDDVRLYIELLSDLVTDGRNSDPYYAAMARVVIAIATLFAGCRLGELLSATIAQVQFVTVRGQVAVAISSTGTKSDIENQRSSPITFGKLKDPALDPLSLFADWINRNDWSVVNCQIEAKTDQFLFPLYKKREKPISTNHFTSKNGIL